MGKYSKKRKEAGSRSLNSKPSSRLFSTLDSSVITVIVTSCVFLLANKHGTSRKITNHSGTPHPPATEEIVDSLLIAPRLPANVDIALLNLSAIPGLPPSQRSKIISDCLKTLDDWSAAIAEQTWKNHHRYLSNPNEFRSEAEWKMAMMCSVLGQDFNVSYDPTLKSTDQQTASNQKFFSNPNSVFLTGCLGKSRIGTCASLPVLYVALGRRMGYPMHLVAAKGHLFARWDDENGLRVNLEAANAGGFTSHPDSHYRVWPAAITPEEEKSRGYLQNLTAEQCLAIFMSTRAICLRSAGVPRDAMVAASLALRLAPNLGGIAETLQHTDAGRHLSEITELNYQQSLLRLRQYHDPMDPTPRYPMPHQTPFSMPTSAMPNPVPNRGFSQPYSRHTNH